MRLSPKSIFFGLVALGLPVAVTIGWQLATPATRSAAVDAPGGAGGIGDAPARPTRAVPAAASSSMPSKSPSVAPSVALSAAAPAFGAPTTAPVTSAPTATPSAPPTEASRDPLPPLTQPPVPTPTDPDPVPSVIPSDSLAPVGDTTFEPRFRWSGH